MSYLPILLGVRREPNARRSSPKGTLPSKAQKDKAMARDAFTCRCCGFESKKFQRVISLSDISPGAKDGELVTVCTFCEMTSALDRAGIGGAGHLIWLPELSQPELNHIVRALYVARESEGPLAKTARRTLEVLMARRAESKKRLGTDDPLLLATALHEQLDDKAYKARAAKLEGIRFLPLDRYFVHQHGKDINVFPNMLAYWMSPEGPYGKTPVSEWTKLFESVSGKAETA